MRLELCTLELDLRRLQQSGQFSDITFLVGPHAVPVQAHFFVLGIHLSISILSLLSISIFYVQRCCLFPSPCSSLTSSCQSCPLRVLPRASRPPSLRPRQASKRGSIHLQLLFGVPVCFSACCCGLSDSLSSYTDRLRCSDEDDGQLYALARFFQVPSLLQYRRAVLKPEAAAPSMCSLRSDLGRMLSSGVAADCTIVLEDGESLRACRPLLTCRSLYFGTLFSGAWRVLP
jgi:hypothetical protein